MFEQQRKPDRPVSRLLKFIALSGTGVLLSLGLCGLDAHLYPRAEFGGSALAGVGFFLGGISGLFLLVTVIMLIFVVVARIFGR